jgi:glyoxylase-like metal-dependent hydrolase (beta-lactamase superfamily II)
MARDRNRWRDTVLVAAALTLTGVVFAAGQSPASGRQAPSQSVRLYVMDCGTLEFADADRYQLKKEEVATTRMSVGCYLVAHPRGTLMWDVGAVPDAAWKPTGGPVSHHLQLPNTERNLTLRKALRPQLAAAGYSPADITYLALSHYHYDHTANANDFAGATWLVRQIERDAMFSPKRPEPTEPKTYSALRNSKTVLITADEHDVFGDGTVVIKLAPGHTPGHQVLYLKLVKTGGVVLSGDLYHYPEERALGRVPTFDVDLQQTRTSRAAIDVFLKKTGAHLWIQHDFTADARLKKAPQFYE